MTKYLKLLFILIFIFSLSCKKYEKKYIISPQNISKRIGIKSDLLKHDDKNTFGEYSSYKIDSLVNFYIKSPKLYQKEFKRKYFLEDTYEELTNNNFDVVDISVLIFSPLTLSFDTISLILTQDGTYRENHTSKSSYIEPNQSKYPYCSEIKFEQDKNINLELLSRSGLLNNNFNPNQKIFYISANQQKTYTIFNKRITPDYKILNNLGIKLKSQKYSTTLTEENISKLNNIIIKTYLDLKSLCNQHLTDEITNLFKKRENHLILKYGFDENDLIEHKLNKKDKILIIDINTKKKNQNINYYAYTIDENDLEKNLHYRLNKMKNLKSVEIKLKKKNNKKFKKIPEFQIIDNKYDQISSSLEKEFKDKKIFNFFNNFLKKKNKNSKYYQNNKTYVILPRNHNQLTINIPSAEFYFFNKKYELQPNQTTKTINQIIEKSDYKSLFNKMKYMVSRKPYIRVNDLDSQVSMNSRKVVSKYCNFKNAEINKKYISKLIYHKDPEIRNDLINTADNLIKGGYIYKNNYKIYCDIRAEDHYPFKGIVNIKNSSYHNQKAIYFYLPHILSKSNKKSYYEVK